MKTMIRPLIAGLVAASIAAPAVAQSCMPAAQRAAFDMRALQSQLMVAALSCDKYTEYGQFMNRNQTELRTTLTTIRTYYRGNSTAVDNYITTLANTHSQEGIRQGSHFCRDVGALFQEALAANGREGLQQVTANRRIATLQEAPACAANATRSAAAAPTRAAQPTRTAQATPAANRSAAPATTAR
ncbi:hypothetical protein ACQW02_04180 [Humitalea sp. 24SJ18S-53]|uniref:hypothetical protein n=1 Tax=Humitalea sp. 24SJ18S-53 TaxID=3422307 RepID=UPI003D66AA45